MNTPLHSIPIALIATLSLAMTGCVAKVERQAKPMFETKSLDACLLINVDLSQSFSHDFGQRAFPLLMTVVTEFFEAQSGNDCKVVLAQTSATSADQTVLFEGTPRQLRQRFDSPEALSEFLMSKSDPNRSPIYEAMGNVIAYANRMPDAGEDTKVLTVTISDLIDSETDVEKRKAHGRVLVDELKTYQAAGHGLALYYVALSETDKWTQIMDRCGFERGQYVIANTLTDQPPMPRLD